MYITEYSWRNVQVRALVYWARNLKALTCAPKNPNFNKLIGSLEEKRQNELQNAKKRLGFKLIPFAIAVWVTDFL